MKTFGYIVKTARFYLLNILALSLLLLLISILQEPLAQYAAAAHTFSNCQADLLVFDRSPQGDNAYLCLSGVYISEQSGSNEVISAELYEFLEGVTYNGNSVINEKNTVCGQYRTLEANEIAVPDDMAKQFDLTLGSTLYLSGKACRVEFIFADVYAIYRVDLASRDYAVFVGKNTFPGKGDSYAAFIQADTELHNRIESISYVRASVKKNMCAFGAMLALLTLLSMSLCALFRTRAERRTLHRMKLTGARGIFAKAVIFESAYLLPSTAIALLLAALLRFGTVALAVVGITCAAYFVWRILWLKISERRNG